MYRISNLVGPGWWVQIKRKTQFATYYSHYVFLALVRYTALATILADCGADIIALNEVRLAKDPLLRSLLAVSRDICLLKGETKI
jgi:hypothetical protein